MIALLICWIRIVLPVRGGATISARCPLPSGVKQIHDARGDRRLACFQLEPLFRIDRRQLVERLDLDVVFGSHAVDIEQLLQPRALSAAMPLDHAAEQQAFAEAELLDHRARHERVGPLAGEIGGRIAEEAVAVGVHFQHAGTGDEGQCVAVVGAFIFLAVLAIAGRAVSAPACAAASAATATTARRSVFHRHRRHRPTTASAVVSILAVISVTSAATSSPPPPPPPAAPTLFLSHVTQNLLPYPMQQRETPHGEFGTELRM